MHEGISKYCLRLSADDAAACEQLASFIKRELPEAEGKIWHGHPVWFLDGNPIVGFSRLKDGIRLLFWSGQSFHEPMLKQEGSFKAAEFRLGTPPVMPKESDLSRWLQKARTIQWDYRNLVKRKGRLEKLSAFDEN